MWAKIGFHEAADIIFQLWAAVVARRQLNEYLDIFCAHWIGYADGGGKGPPQRRAWLLALLRDALGAPTKSSTRTVAS